MGHPLLNTYFAPAERASMESIRDARSKVLASPLLGMLLEALPDFALVLNRERQIVAANGLFLQAFNVVDFEHMIGKRPGEAVACILSFDTPAGCGTGEHCSTCGAVVAMLRSTESSTRITSECRLTVNPENPVALDLQVVATPVELEGERFTLCILKDISTEKRRLVLERVFFHDVINTVGGIHGVASLLAEHAGLEADREAEYRQWMITLTERLLEEINHHRKLLAAERGEFKPMLGLVSVSQLVQEVHTLYLNHGVCEHRNLVLGHLPDCQIISDGALLRKILGNLVKNALEATPRGGTVAMSASEGDDEVSFRIHNPTVMPRNVQLQLFQRSFSTKGEGRGIGTYSIRLFGERYLKGNIDFTSREPDGTTFIFTIPKHVL